MVRCVYGAGFSRGGELETIGSGHVEKWRYVEALAAIKMLIEIQRLTVLMNHVTVHLAEGIPHLSDDCAQRAVAVAAIEQADGVEHIAEHPWQAQQVDRAVIQLDAVPGCDGGHPRPQGAITPVAVVAIKEREQVPAVITEQAAAPGGTVHMIDVQP